MGCYGLGGRDKRALILIIIHRYAHPRSRTHTSRNLTTSFLARDNFGTVWREHSSKFRNLNLEAHKILDRNN